jgi:glutaredoxin
MTPLRWLRFTLTAITALAAFAAAGQQLYRWTDEKGRTHITDTPPPPSAKGVQKKGAAASDTATVQLPFELTAAIKDFPVVLYTAPACKDACSDARALLNKRGVPFREVMVWDEETGAELKQLVGEIFIPTLLVGRTVQKGYISTAYDALLDSARYPKAGTVPVRSQAAAPLPKGYVEAQQEAAKAEPVKPEVEQPKGPYSPGAAPQQRRTPAQK